MSLLLIKKKASQQWDRPAHLPKRGEVVSGYKDTNAGHRHLQDPFDNHRERVYHILPFVASAKKEKH